MNKYIIQAIRNELNKSYSGKPHLADLPYDRRTRNPEKLQERIDAINERINENTIEIRAENDRINFSNEEFDYRWADGKEQWDDFYQKLSQGEMVPDDFKFGDDYYSYDEYRYDELTGTFDEINSRLTSLQKLDAQSFDIDDIHEIKTVNSNINRLINNYYSGTRNKKKYTNLFDDCIEQLDIIQDSRKNISKLEKELEDYRDELEKTENKLKEVTPEE